MRFEAVAHAAHLYVKTRLGKVLVWDATAPNSWAPSYAPLATKEPGCCRDRMK